MSYLKSNSISLSYISWTFKVFIYNFIDVLANVSVHIFIFLLRKCPPHYLLIWRDHLLLSVYLSNPKYDVVARTSNSQTYNHTYFETSLFIKCNEKEITNKDKHLQTSAKWLPYKDLFQFLKKKKARRWVYNINFTMKISVVKSLYNSLASKISLLFVSRLSKSFVEDFKIPMV